VNDSTSLFKKMLGWVQVRLLVENEMNRKIYRLTTCHETKIERLFLAYALLNSYKFQGLSHLFKHRNNPIRRCSRIGAKIAPMSNSARPIRTRDILISTITSQLRRPKIFCI